MSRDELTRFSYEILETEAGAETLPHRRRYLLLVVAFLRRLLELHLATRPG